MDNHTLPIGEKIKIIRTAQDRRQRLLARACGVHVTYISLIENGKMLPTPQQVAAIEGVLRVKLDSPEVDRALSMLLCNGKDGP